MPVENKISADALSNQGGGEGGGASGLGWVDSKKGGKGGGRHLGKKESYTGNVQRVKRQWISETDMDMDMDMDHGH